MRQEEQATRRLRKVSGGHTGISLLLSRLIASILGVPKPSMGQWFTHLHLPGPVHPPAFLASPPGCLMGTLNSAVQTVQWILSPNLLVLRSFPLIHLTHTCTLSHTCTHSHTHLPISWSSLPSQLTHLCFREAFPDHLFPAVSIRLLLWTSIHPRLFLNRSYGSLWLCVCVCCCSMSVSLLTRQLWGSEACVHFASHQMASVQWGAGCRGGLQCCGIKKWNKQPKQWHPPKCSPKRKGSKLSDQEMEWKQNHLNISHEMFLLTCKNANNKILSKNKI